MITGFEDITYDITEEEKQTARIVYKLIVKAKDPITNKAICKHLNDSYNIKVTEPRIRKMINWMHVSGYMPKLIASSAGYSLAKTKEELLSYAESLKGRVDAINARFSATMKGIKNW